MPALTEAQALRFARLALAGVVREYPNHLTHLLHGPSDVQSPRALHPSFYGCYDWHSAVHGHWLLARFLRLYPRSPLEAEARAALGENLRAEHLAREVAYFQRPGGRAFERPYGWGWLLALAAELRGWDDRDARLWSAGMEPLSDLIAGLFVDYLPRQRYPVRTGTHNNTAFGLLLALDYAAASRHTALSSAVTEAARRYYQGDTDYPAAFEPSGEDFLSAALVEAALMARVLENDELAAWFDRYLPGLVRGEPRSLLTPAVVTDRADPRLVHLDGLNLSRAFCMRRLARALPAGHPAGAVLRAAADRHAEAGLAHVESGEYVGEHWLATFAVLLLTDV